MAVCLNLTVNRASRQPETYTDWIIESDSAIAMTTDDAVVPQQHQSIAISGGEVLLFELEGDRPLEPGAFSDELQQKFEEIGQSVADVTVEIVVPQQHWMVTGGDRCYDIRYAQDKLRIFERILSRIWAKLICTPDNNLAVVNCTDAADNILVFYRSPSVPKTSFAVEPDRPFSCPSSRFIQRSDDFQPQEIDLDTIAVYYHRSLLAEIVLDVEEYRLPEALLHQSSLLEQYRFKNIRGHAGSPYIFFHGYGKTSQSMEIELCQRKNHFPLQVPAEQFDQKIWSKLESLGDQACLVPVIDMVRPEATANPEALIFKHINLPTLQKLSSTHEFTTHPMAMAEILAIMHKLIVTVKVLHEHNSVHRGIAPGNILIGRESESLYLLGFEHSDIFYELFGLDPAPYQSIEPGCLRSLMPFYFLDFMPPEFFTQERRFDPRGDIYCLGAIFYSLLFNFAPYTYHLLYDGQTDQDRFSVYQAYYREQRNTPPTVVYTLQMLEQDCKNSGKFKQKIRELGMVINRLYSIEQKVLSVVSSVIERCLQIDPQQRYQNIYSLMQDIELLITQNTYEKLSHTAKIDIRQEPRRGLRLVDAKQLQKHIDQEVTRRQFKIDSNRVGEIKHIQENLAQLDQQLQGKKYSLRQLENRLIKKEVEETRLVSRISEKESLLKSLRDRSEQYRQQIQLQQSQIDGQQAELARKEQEFSQKQAELEHEQQEVKRQKQELEQKKQELEQKNAAMTQQLRQIAQDQQHTVKIHRNYQVDLDCKQKELEQLQQEIIRYRGDIDQVQRETSLSQNYRQELERQQHEMQRLQGEVNRLQSEVNRLQQEIDRFQKRSHNTMLSLQGAQQENHELMEELEAKQQQLDETRLTIEQVQKNLEQLQQHLQIFQGQKLLDEAIDIGSLLPGSNGIYYRILDKLGKGGMGEVFRAVRSDNDKVVAIKVVLPHRYDQQEPATEMTPLEAMMRFVSESYILLNFKNDDNPYVLKALDFRQHMSLNYLVTEYVDGVSVEDLLLKNTIKSLLFNGLFTFDFGENLDVACSDDLDNGKMPQALRQRFDNHQSTLSNKVTIAKIDGKWWRISRPDGNQWWWICDQGHDLCYSIIQNGNNLEIYAHERFADDPGKAEKMEQVLLSDDSVPDEIKQRMHNYYNNPLGMTLATTIAAQVAKGLEYMNQKGVVHRDIKTSNIMVTLMPDGKIASKIVDFGIAHHYELKGRLTGRHHTMGSKTYISPQQLQEEDIWDIRNDIYSLGIVYYEMATGRQPFEGTTEEIIMAHLRSPVPDPQSINQQVTLAMTAVIETMLEKKMERRYAQVKDLVGALENLKVCERSFNP